MVDESGRSVSVAFEKLPVGVKLLSAGAAACFADFSSFPLDTAKVRLQIQGEVRVVSGQGLILNVPQNGNLHYRGILGTIGTISREEGFRSLYNGLNAGLQRQMCFASVRLGMYEPVKAFYQRLLKIDQNNMGGLLDISGRIMAGLTTGGLAVILAQPTDVVKVRFQAHAQTGPHLGGTWNAYKTIFTKEGIGGLWKGFIPNIGRNAIVNVSEIVCYDLVKEFFIKRELMRDNLPCHFTAAVIAGFCATLCASPLDVIKTRYMSSPPGKYSGAADCALQTFVREGHKAFYKGFWPSFSRLVSWNIVMWVSYEQLKRLILQNYAHHSHL